MREDFLALIEESTSLNPAVFSLIRLQLMSSLAGVGQDGVTYRELKAAFQVSDGALYSNLKALETMGYVESARVTLGTKNLESYILTHEGLVAWNRAKAWLLRFLGGGGE